jgi:phosphate transport system substrate-binding protein
MKRVGSGIIVCAAMVWVMGLGISVSIAQGKQAVRIDGAASLSDVIQTYAELYMKQAPNCAIMVTGTSTGQGISKLIDGEADVAAVSRKITPEEAKRAQEKGLSLGSKYVGQVEVAVITNDKNNVGTLTMGQLAKIFKGEVTNWNEVGGPNEAIKVTARAVPESGVAVLFQDVALKGAPYAKGHTVMSSYHMTLRVCGKSFGIGYIPTATSFFDKIGDYGVKIVNLKKDENSAPYPLTSGVTKETMYPISLSFFLYWNTKSENPCIKELVGFVEKQAE